MADKKLNIKVSTTGAGKAKQEIGGLNGAISKMGKAVGIASAAYFGARGLISGFSSAINLAGIQEQAEKKLEVALGKTSKALLDHASSLQKMTTFGDEAIIGVQASLAAFIKDEEQIKKATEATLDMAVAMGMDLKAAGDLVAKTLGSSTNAMSRYGIEVKGAVGSTERLESLTNNVATLFGGQASAQAETMTGALEQMKNALGDVAENIGESLSPLVVKLAKGINSLATSTADESGEADRLFGVLKDVNATEEVRERAMQAINEQYGDYLPNLIDETFTLQDIEKAQDRVTGAMLKRIALSVNEEKIADLMREKSELLDKEPLLIERADRANANMHKNTFGGVVGTTLAQDALNESREKQKEIQTEINRLNESAVSLAESFSDTILRMPERPLVIVPSAQAELLKDVVIDMGIMNDLMDEAFGDETSDATDDNIDYASSFGEISAAAGTAMRQTSDLLAATSGDSKRQQVQAMRLAQFAAIADTASGVMKAFKQGGTLGFITGAGIAATGAAQIATIQNAIASAQGAETGFDGIVNRPTMFMTGENNKAERVSVTPLTPGMNKNGPQGGITLNISAPLVDETVIDSIIPAIQKAQRMNLA
jgi:hypothetical protein